MLQGFRHRGAVDALPAQVVGADDEGQPVAVALPELAEKAARGERKKVHTIDQAACIKCGLCTQHCETQANPYPRDKWKSGECIYCERCASICPTAAIGFEKALASRLIVRAELTTAFGVNDYGIAIAMVPMMIRMIDATRATIRGPW